jgi:nickel/cobalt transporter (NiCoT) family protein
MLYSYSGFPERSFFVFARSENSETAKEHAEIAISNVPVPQVENVSEDKCEITVTEIDLQDKKDSDQDELPKELLNPAESIVPQGHASDSAMARDIRVKMNIMSGLSIILTLMSILVAFRYDYSID